MAIASAEARVWLIPPLRLSCRMSRLIGRENSDAQDQLGRHLMNAKELPIVEFADYTFVFH